MADTLGLVMLDNGDDPANGHGRGVRSRDRARAGRRVDSGQIRSSPATTTRSRWRRGDFAACIAWSGDIAQLVRTTRTSSGRMPEKGGIIWTDNMFIPHGRQRADGVDVHELRLRPEDRGPDRGRHELHLVGQGRRRKRRSSSTPTPAANQLIFPNDETLAQVHLNDPAMAQQRRLHHDVAGGPGPVGPRSTAHGLRFFHRHPGLDARTCCSRPGSPGSAIFFLIPLGVPRVPVAPVRDLPELRVHVGVLELHGRDPRLPRAALPLVPLRGHRDRRAASCSPIRSSTGSRSGRGRGGTSSCSSSSRRSSSRTSSGRSRG